MKLINIITFVFLIYPNVFPLYGNDEKWEVNDSFKNDACEIIDKALKSGIIDSMIGDELKKVSVYQSKNLKSDYKKDVNVPMKTTRKGNSPVVVVDADFFENTKVNEIRLGSDEEKARDISKRKYYAKLGHEIFGHAFFCIMAKEEYGKIEKEIDDSEILEGLSIAAEVITYNMFYDPSKTIDEYMKAYYRGGEGYEWYKSCAKKIQEKHPSLRGEKIKEAKYRDVYYCVKIGEKVIKSMKKKYREEEIFWRIAVGIFQDVEKILKEVNDFDALIQSDLKTEKLWIERSSLLEGRASKYLDYSIQNSEKIEKALEGYSREKKRLADSNYYYSIKHYIKNINAGGIQYEYLEKVNISWVDELCDLQVKMLLLLVKINDYKSANDKLRQLEKLSEHMTMKKNSGSLGIGAMTTLDIQIRKFINLKIMRHIEFMDEEKKRLLEKNYYGCEELRNLLKDGKLNILNLFAEDYMKKDNVR